MAWFFGLRPQIVRRAHETFPEVMHPHAVDYDARGQWVAFARDRLCQFQASAPLLERGGLAAAEDLEKVARNNFTTVLGLPTNEHGGIVHVTVFDHHGA